MPHIEIPIMVTLVTGATGLVGNNVVRALLQRGRQVRVLVRESSDPRPLEGLDVEVVRGDIQDETTVERACRGASTVIHAAAHVCIGWADQDKYEAVNVEGTRRVAKAVNCNRGRLVHVSTIDALGVGSRGRPADEETHCRSDVDCPYVASKRSAENVVLKLIGEGLDAVIVNPSCVFGPYDWKPSSGRMLLEVASGRGLFAPRGANDYCDARDVAAGIVAAAERGKTARRYILGGESMTYLEAWSLLAEVTGARPPLCQIGPVVLSLAGAVGDLKYKISGREGAVNSASVAMSRLPKYFTSARAEAELGYRSRSVREAAESAWHWFQQHGYAPNSRLARRP